MCTVSVLLVEPTSAPSASGLASRPQHLRLDTTADEEARIDRFVCAVTNGKRERLLHFGSDSADKRRCLTWVARQQVTYSARTATSVKSA